MRPRQPRPLAWTDQRERGATLPLRVLLWAVLRFGWPVGQAVLPFVALWFLLTGGRARRASREYLGRALGRPARLRDVARHFHSFACAILDRVFLLSGRTGRYRIETQGLEHMTAVLAQGRGCVLLGAHLGSFEVLRTVGHHSPVPVRPLMYRRNGGPLTALLDALDPQLNESIIPIGDPGSMLRVREALERGEVVGILADRAPGALRRIRVPFLGRRASFPAGPFMLAAALGVPVVLFYGVRTGLRRYAVRFEPFADRIALRRSDRMAELEGWVARYAAALERACVAHPFDWFNFFPFWQDSDAHEDASPGAGGRDGGAGRPAPGARQPGPGATGPQARA